MVAIHADGHKQTRENPSFHTVHMKKIIAPITFQLCNTLMMYLFSQMAFLRSVKGHSVDRHHNDSHSVPLPEVGKHTWTSIS